MDNEHRKLFRGSELIIFGLIIVVSLAGFFMFGKSGEYAIISSDGKPLDTVSLSESGDYEYEELRGVVFTVENNSIRISHNDCKDLICVRTGAVSHNGEAVVCMPKKISVEIKSGNDNELDAVLR